MNETKKIFTQIIGQKQISSPGKKDSPKSQGPDTLVPANKKDPPLEGVHYTNIGVMWTLKHETISPKCYELIIKEFLKGNTHLELNNFYNHIKVCLNVVIIPQENLLPDYQSIKIHSEFEEYFAPDCSHPSYSWNEQKYTSLGQSVLVKLANNNGVKYSVAPHSYKSVNNHAHEISGWTI